MGALLDSIGGFGGRADFLPVVTGSATSAGFVVVGDGGGVDEPASQPMARTAINNDDSENADLFTEMVPVLEIGISFAPCETDPGIQEIPEDRPGKQDKASRRSIRVGTDNFTAGACTQPSIGEQ